MTIGPMFTASFLEDAIETTIRTYGLSYLAEMERITGRGTQTMPLFRSWVRSPEQRAYVEDQTPALVIVVGGTTDQPVIDAGRYSAQFTAGLGIIVSTDRRESATKLAKDYAAAVRSLVLQNPSLGGVACGVHWVEEQYEGGGGDQRREYAAAVVSFVIDVNDVADQNGWVSVDSPPPSDPYATLPDPTEITEVNVDVTRNQ